MPRFPGRRVLVTGASRGVGLAAALAFAREGAGVALLAREGEALADARARAAELAPRALAVPVDLADADAAAGAVRCAIAELGGLDVLVSNAATVLFGPFDGNDPDDVDRVVRVTFGGAVACVDAALPALRESGGALVATGSLMSAIPLPMFSSYAAAKHALRAWLGARRPELEAAGVSVSVVHPGAVATPLWHQVTSATGLLPRFPPEGYRPEVVAEALLDRVEDPVPELFVGAETRAIRAAVHVPVLGEALLRFISLWYASGREPAAAPGSLRVAPHGADRSSRLVPRPSLLSAVTRRS